MEKNRSAESGTQNLTNQSGASAELDKTLYSDDTVAPDSDAGGDTDIQELLRKYLPEYAEEEKKEVVQKAKPAEPKPQSVQTMAYTVDDAEVEKEPETKADAPRKKGGLFARLRASAEEEADSAAPDAALFEQLSRESGNDTEAAPELVEIAGEPLITEDFPGEIQPEAGEISDDEAAGVKETAEEETVPEMDETDLNLMVAFGLEEQLDKRIGAGTADKVAAQNDADVREYEEQQRRAAEYEYTERAQTARIADAYKFAHNSLKIKLAAGALLTVLLFFFENITLFGVQFAGALDPAVYPVVYIMISLQLMLLVCAVAYEQIFTGVRNLLTGRPTPESVLSVLAVFGILYSAYAAIVSQQGVEPVMYNFAVAACAEMALLFAFFNTKREIFSFNIVSSKKPKFVFRRIPASAASPESQAFGALDEDNPDVLQTLRTDFVDGYFGRTSAVLNSTRVYVTAMLTVVTAAAVLLGIFAGIAGAGARDAVATVYVAVLAAIPMSMFFTYSYPFYKANREAYENDSTIVGESSLDEYSGASIISFDDKNVFPSYGVKVQNIKIYNNNRIDRVLYYAASAFSAAGGPLSDVFEVATMEMGHSDDVEIVSAGVGYLETRVDGRSIVFGRSAILTELGILIPEEIVEEDSYIEGDLSILYMIREGQLVAKMFVKYVMDADFEFIVRQFTQNGTCVCVKTLDPNIDEEMIFSKVKGKRYPLKVIKIREGGTECANADSGIVTRGTTKSLLQVVSYCDTVLSVKRTNMIISVVSAIVTLVIMFIISLSGNLGAVGSWLVVVNQLFWMIPALLTTKLYIK